MEERGGKKVVSWKDLTSFAAAMLVSFKSDYRGKVCFKKLGNNQKKKKIHFLRTHRFYCLQTVKSCKTLVFGKVLVRQELNTVKVASVTSPDLFPGPAQHQHCHFSGPIPWDQHQHCVCPRTTVCPVRGLGGGVA